MRGLLRLVQVGSVVAFVVALFHPTEAVQIGGQQGQVFQSWVVLILAPVVMVVCQVLISVMRRPRVR